MTLGPKAAFDAWARQRNLGGYMHDVAEAAWTAALATFPKKQPLHSDPVIDALFKILPVPGSEWPVEDRQKWLEFAEYSIKRAYAGKATPPLLVLLPQESDAEKGEPE